MDNSILDLPGPQVQTWTLTGILDLAQNPGPDLDHQNPGPDLDLDQNPGPDLDLDSRPESWTRPGPRPESWTILDISWT